jgi:hypothetical protein
MTPPAAAVDAATTSTPQPINAAAAATTTTDASTAAAAATSTRADGSPPPAPALAPALAPFSYSYSAPFIWVANGYSNKDGKALPTKVELSATVSCQSPAVATVSDLKRGIAQAVLAAHSVRLPLKRMKLVLAGNQLSNTEQLLAPLGLAPSEGTAAAASGGGGGGAVAIKPVYVVCAKAAKTIKVRLSDLFGSPMPSGQPWEVTAQRDSNTTFATFISGLRTAHGRAQAPPGSM